MRRALLLPLAAILVALLAAFGTLAGTDDGRRQGLGDVPGTPSSAVIPRPSPTATASPTPVPMPTRAPEATPTPTPAPATPTPVPATPAPTPTPPSGVGGPTEDVRWDLAIQTPDGARLGVVAAGSLNIRSAPRLDAPVVGRTYQRHPIPVYDEVAGDVVAGNAAWYRVGPERYVAAAYVEPFLAPRPATHHEGHWVDVDLSDYYAVAYDGDTPVYAALIIVGRDGYDTPTGEFRVLRRVANETMDAGTLGIPKGDPNYYYLPNVKYTQYFTNAGHALHTNYWSAPSQFGSRGSHGCVNLQEQDAAWFWRFLTIGSLVRVHD